MGSNRFLITVFIALGIAVASIYFIVTNFAPNTLLFIFVLAVAGFIGNIFGALILFIFATPVGLETKRDLFRRCYRKSVWIGLLVVLALLAQYYFDLL